MKPVRAIVLTYDKYRVFTDHMIRCYEKLWPNHPFIFHVPYQELPRTVSGERVKYIRCSSGIKATVELLLENFDDEEWVYWCIDDKYPLQLDVQRIESIHRNVIDTKKHGMDGLLFCRCRGMLDKKNLTGKKIVDDQGDVFLERKNYEQIWIHQYLKVKVLRQLFNSFPEKIPAAKIMDSLKAQVKKPQNHQIYVTGESLGVFGESTTRGVITRNCYKSLEQHNLTLPSWCTHVTTQEIVMGHDSRTAFSRLIKRFTKYFS